MYPRANQSPHSISLRTKKRSAQGSTLWCPLTWVGKAPNKPIVISSSRSLYPLPRPTATWRFKRMVFFGHVTDTVSERGFKSMPTKVVGDLHPTESFKTWFDQLWHVFHLTVAQNSFLSSRLYTWSYACIHVYLVCSYFAFLLARTGCSGRP